MAAVRRVLGRLACMSVCASCCMAGLAVAPVNALGEGAASGVAEGPVAPGAPSSGGGGGSGGSGGSASGSGGSSSPSDGSSSSGENDGSAGAGSDGSGSLGGPLTIEGSPTEAEQRKAAEEAKLTSPEAVAAREESQTKFEGLNAEQARQEAKAAFPGLIGEPAGGPPRLPAGESVTGYPSDDAAQIALPEGKHAVLEAMAPIALETSGGGHVPIDLGLGENSGAFEPRMPAVGVRIPKQLAAGVSLGSTGVSLTPVDAQGSTLGGSEGALDGASVLYANTQSDTDTVVKPTTLGFEADTILRSVESPDQLYFRVGLPEGASLVQAKGGPGTVEVVKENATLAVIADPSARDAAGTVVPVSMSVSGDMLVLSVDEGSGVQFPVEVDPTVEDKEMYLAGEGRSGNWAASSGGQGLGAGTNYVEGGLWLFNIERREYTEGSYALLQYGTQGKSHIYAFLSSNMKEEGPPTGIRGDLFLESNSQQVEGKEDVLPTTGEGEEKVCVLETCAGGGVNSSNQSNKVSLETVREVFRYDVGGGGVDTRAGRWRVG